MVDDVPDKFVRVHCSGANCGRRAETFLSQIFKRFLIGGADSSKHQQRALCRRHLESDLENSPTI